MELQENLVGSKLQESWNLVTLALDTLVLCENQLSPKTKLKLSSIP